MLGVSQRRKEVVAIALGVLAVGASGAAAQRIVIPAGPDVSLLGHTSPAKLPAKIRTPLRLTLEGSVSGPEGSAPGIESLSFEFDRNGTLFTKGLPRCSISSFEGEVERTKPPCTGTLIGRGEIEFEVSFREEAPLRGKAPLEIFNGVPRDGHPTLVYRAYPHLPAATTLLASSTIEPGHGKFGTRTTIDVPELVGGRGRLTGFHLELGRSWRYGDRRVSLLGARCPKDRFLAADAELGLSENASEVGELTELCGPRA
jgi:hypothetical protein